MVLVLLSSFTIVTISPLNITLTMCAWGCSRHQSAWIHPVLPLARWYKRRVRDEDYNAHRVVEEVYDRYLSAQH